MGYCRGDIVGGTLEPGETYRDTIRRELPEEAGARLVTFELFGAWHCHSSAPQPCRPHLPHPEFYRVVGCGEIELVGQLLEHPPKLGGPGATRQLFFQRPGLVLVGSEDAMPVHVESLGNVLGAHHLP